MHALLQDPMFFYGIALVLFLLLAYSKGKKPALEWIDGEIAKIRDQLGQAEELRAEAELTLEKYKSQQMESLAQANAIIKHARDEAAALKAQTEHDMQEKMARHEKQAIERIRRLEIEAEAAVRKALVDMAIETARKAFLSQIDDATTSRLIDQAIAEIPASAGDKAKAA